MYYKGDQMVKKLNYGTQEIKAVYIGEKKIYPNITGQQTGSDPTPWTYDLPKRTRTVTPWTQDVYADGSLGDKVYGPEEPQTETATVSESKGTWSYTTTTSSSTRTRVVNNVYTFTDEVKTAFKNNETETGERSQGSWTYDWANSKRTATVTYKYSDATETIPLTETGTVTYNFTITPADTTAIAAGGGSKSIDATGNIDKKWNNVVAASTTATVTSLKFSGSTPAGFTISGLNVNAANRGMTEGAILTANVYGIATVDGKAINSGTIIVTQQANTKRLYIGSVIVGNDYYGYFSPVNDLSLRTSDTHQDTFSFNLPDIAYLYNSNSRQSIQDYYSLVTLNVTSSVTWIKIISQDLKTNKIVISFEKNTESTSSDFRHGQVIVRVSEVGNSSNSTPTYMNFTQRI